MSHHPSLAVRAVLAVSLFIGFYVLALGITALLIYLPYFEYTTSHHIHLKILFFCLIGAAMIIWSVLPRFDKFVAPGPEIDLTKNPEFYAIVKDIASRSNQLMPEQIFLVPELNAWVSSRGGFMGIGSKRVMGIGLPLLDEITVDQFRAVLAHEFGHYYGGDVKLGPWIYKTRSAIGRTINSLGHHSGLLQRPFLWYGNTFLRITYEISRQQEFAADALAAQLIGKKSTMDGLTHIHRIGPAFNWFWQNELEPILNKSYYAFISNGFKQYLQSSDILKAMDSLLQKQLTDNEVDAFNTHPSLRERLEALRDFPETSAKNDERPASTLFGQQLNQLETTLMNWFSSSTSQKLNIIEWNEVASKIYPEIWAEKAKQCKEKFSKGTKAIDFPLIIGDKTLFPTPSDISLPDGITADQMRIYLIISELSSLLAHTLVHDGWEPRTSPGTSVVLFKNDKSFAAFDLTTKLLQEEISPNAWREACTIAGIENISIA